MQKPAYSMSIVSIKAGQTVPKSLLLKLFSENTSAIGFAVRLSTGIEVEKFNETDGVDKEVPEWTTILEKTKTSDRLLCLSAFPEKFNDAEMQPWIILKDSKDKPLLLLACEGDFPKYTQEGQSEFFALVNDYLGPKIEGLYKLLNNDPKKLMDHLRSKDFAADLDLLCGHRGVFEFMPAEGEPFAHGKNDIGGEYDWGRASNIYEYTEAVQEAGTNETPAPKRSRFASDEPAPAVSPPAAVPPKADPPTKPIEKVAAELPKKRRIDIPKNLHGKRKKVFIRDALGNLPDNWDNLTYLEVDMETTVKSLADLDKTAAGVKDMRADAPLPVISGPQQAAVAGFIKKHLDGNSNRVDNPLEIQKIESKLAVFTEVAGLTTGLDDLDSWPTSVMAAFVKEHPEAAWLAILEYRADRRKRKALILQGDKKLSDLAGTEEVPLKPSTTPPVSPSPGTGAPLEAEPVVKKSRYA